MITSIKGFDKNLSCHGFQFEIGKTYKVKGKVKVCSNGFHSCPSDEDTGPLSVFEYYPPATSRYCEVQAEGNTDRQGNKIASAKITVGVEITLHELIGRFINWATNKAGGTLAASNSVDYGAASNSGDSGAASNSGDYGAASNSGDHGAASNSGNRGAASNSGYHGAASNSGTRGAASNSGYQGAASNSGYQGAASNSGDYGAASNSGTRGAASNSGTRGAASNSGDYGAASNSGIRGAASNSGDYGAAMSHSYGGNVMCEGDGQALYCSEFDVNFKLVSNACGITGQDGIRAGVWYTCKGGKLVEVA